MAKSQSEQVIESSQVATCIKELMLVTENWSGTASELYAKLESIAEELKINIKPKYWPKAPNALSRRLNEIIPSLKEIGIQVDTSEDDKKRKIIIITKISTISTISTIS
jgi:hypothetical protein